MCCFMIITGEIKMLFVSMGSVNCQLRGENDMFYDSLQRPHVMRCLHASVEARAAWADRAALIRIILVTVSEN